MPSPRARFGIAAIAVIVSVGGLVAWALTGSTAYYRTPSELAAGPTLPSERVRVAGKVVEGSVTTQGTTTNFAVTDGRSEIEVTTEDVLPDAFAPGIEVVAEGAMSPSGVFSASAVLAKCPSKFKARRN